MAKARPRKRQVRLTSVPSHPDAPERLEEALAAPVPARVEPLWEDDDGPAVLARTVQQAGFMLGAHTGPGQALARLRLAAVLAQVLEGNLPWMVEQARAEGGSWADVGAALDVTRQTAHERYGRTSSGRPDA